MATRTISNAGGAFNVVGTWVEGIVPVAGDDVVATGTSGNLTVTATAGGGGLNSFIMTGYVGLLTMNATLVVSGTFTLVNTMTLAGTAGQFSLSTTGATATSGGLTIPCGVLISGGTTWTLGDNWNANGLVTCGASTNAVVLNGFQITCNGGLRFGGTSGSVSGTTNFIVTAGNIDAPSINTASVGSFRNNITTNGAGNITVVSLFNFRGGTWTHTSGNVITTNSSLIIAASTTLNTAGIIWNIVNLTATLTLTLSSALSAASIGLGTFGSTSVITMAGTAGFSCTSLTQTTIASSPATLKLVAGLTYTVGTITFPGCPGQANTLVSVTASSPAYLYLTDTQADVSYVSVTDISVLGCTLYVYKGTILRTSSVALLPNVAGIMRPMPIRGI